jgi:K+-transporting ATPase ATPase C chain
LGPSNPELARQAAERVQELGGTLDNPVPADLVSASGSGLDPHISPAAAFYQVERVAAARGIEPAQLVELIRNEVEAPFLGLFGAERVNVLELNLELDRLSP